ncbi:MAG: dTDP-4-amino-4,6-dideoxygalactose transaminase [Parachlamydiaceae bacterium]
MNLPIPFNRPSPQGNELAYFSEALQRGHISGDGFFSKECHRLIEKVLGVHKALMTTSCTHALEMSALLLDIQPGDEVILPSYTFVSTVNAFALRGAKPIFIDIRSDTLNFDETELERLISSKTRAIVLVHYAGVACEMDTIMQIAKRYQIPVVEDNAHGLFGVYKGRYLGTFGQLATQSFHETKNFTCGEGGMLLINDPQLVERAKIIREKGTNRDRFFRGQVDKYTWVDLGSSYLPSDMLAGYLLGQLEVRDKIQSKRARIWQNYFVGLEDWANRHGIRLPVIPEHCTQTYHMFYLLFPSFDKRQSTILHLKSQDILSVFHYMPLHLSEMAGQWGYRAGDFPVTERISDTIVRLPFYNEITETEQQRVIDALLTLRIV